MVTWDPWHELDRLRRDLERATSDLTSRVPTARLGFLPGRAARQYPLVNVHDDGEALHVEALAPGVDPAKLEVTVVQGTLTIAGEKPLLADVPPERVHRAERAAGRFLRTVELGVPIDADQVQAEYRLGLLLLTLPRAAAARPRRVAVATE